MGWLLSAVKEAEHNADRKDCTGIHGRDFKHFLPRWWHLRLQHMLASLLRSAAHASDEDSLKGLGPDVAAASKNQVPRDFAAEHPISICLSITFLVHFRQ